MQKCLGGAKKQGGHLKRSGYELASARASDCNAGVCHRYTGTEEQFGILKVLIKPESPQTQVSKMSAGKQEKQTKIRGGRTDLIIVFTYMSLDWGLLSHTEENMQSQKK